jgi:hypothetical protein
MTFSSKVILPVTSKNTNLICEEIEIPIENSKPSSSKQLKGVQGKPNFKKPNWVSKFRSKEKNSRASKSIKNLMQDNLDSLSLTKCIFFQVYF